MKSLNRAQIRRYREQGFLFPFRAFSTEAAAAYRADVERTCADTAGPAAAASETVSYRVKPYLLFTWAAKMVREPFILDAVEDLIGPDIMVFHTTMWWKTKGSPSRVPWHQDGTYFGLAPYEHVTALGGAESEQHPDRMRAHRAGNAPRWADAARGQF